MRSVDYNWENRDKMAYRVRGPKWKEMGGGGREKSTIGINGPLYTVTEDRSKRGGGRERGSEGRRESKKRGNA